jgi:hypothetical protein
MKNKRYEACAEALREILKKGIAKDGERLTITWLAKQTELSEPTLRACKAGDRYLTESAARKIIESLEGLKESDKKLFLEKTREGRKVAVREPGLARRLAAADASLSVEGLPYLPFSNGEDQFVDQFLDRFFRLSGIEKKPLDESPRLADRAARLLKHESDIAVNLFCTLQRLRLLDFLLFPIRLSISAVIPARFRGRRAEVQNRLLGKTVKSSVRLKLVVTEGEVGHQHATTVSGYRDADMVVLKTWKLDDFVAGLTDLDVQCKDTDGTVPVLFCDEVISLLVLRQLNEKKLGDRYVLVFPLTTKLNIRRFEARRETPEYRLGLAIDRENKELKEYLSESLQFYLLTDPEYLARLYANLFGELQTYVALAISMQESRALDQESSSATEIIRHRLARDFARYALRLDREEIERYRDRFLPWQHILRRAYQIVCTEQARDRLRIRKHVEDILRERLGEDFIQSEIPKERLSLIKGPLQEEFDVPLDLAGSNPPKRTLEGIVSAVQTALLASATSAAPFDFPVIVAQDEDEMHVKELFSEFERELVARNIPVDAPLPNENSVTLLAVLQGSYIGCVQIGGPKGGTIRLTRLYVRKRWRGGRGPSASLVWKAIEHAAEQMQGVKVVIKESRAAPRVLEFFRQQGFENDLTDGTGQQLQYPLAEFTSQKDIEATHAKTGPGGRRQAR